jgi:restriction system protein
MVIAPLTPEHFEIEVKNIIETSGLGLSYFSVQHLEKLDGADGTYEIDITARFRALGADFLVLIECKHYRHPVKREVVQVLYDRIRAVGAHKGMIFSTAGFQSGAIKYAKAHGIALVEINEGRSEYGSRGPGETFRVPSWYQGWVANVSDDGHVTYNLIERSEPEILFPMFCSKNRAGIQAAESMLD